MSWKGGTPVYDFRTWLNDETGKHPLKGITLNEAEFEALKEIIKSNGNN